MTSLVHSLPLCRRPTKTTPVSSVGNSLLLCPHRGFMFTFDSMLKGDAQQWVTSLTSDPSWLKLLCFIQHLSGLYHPSLLVSCCVVFPLHSIALLWPDEWEVISRHFLVDQPISICRISQATPNGSSVEYTTQPGEIQVLMISLHCDLMLLFCYVSLRTVQRDCLTVFVFCVQSFVGTAEKVSSSSNRGTWESTHKPQSTSARS